MSDSSLVSNEEKYALLALSQLEKHKNINKEERI